MSSRKQFNNSRKVITVKSNDLVMNITVTISDNIDLDSADSMSIYLAEQILPVLVNCDYIDKTNYSVGVK